MDIEKYLAQEAKKRQGQRNDLKPENVPAEPPESRQNESREQAAKITGASGKGVQMAKKVAAVAPEIAAGLASM